MTTSPAHLRFQKQLESSIGYLNSSEAQRSLDNDPYWPKWNNPWWHMTLMWELGAASSIPTSARDRLLTALQKQYIHFFPLTEAEVPAGVDPISGIMCHCGLGTAYQILRTTGVDVDAKLPWVREWFVKYQLPDGGWNCDETAYTRAQPKSSVVSTLPVLESLLAISDRSPEETNALDAGAEYLVKRRLVHSLTTGEVINEDWLRLTFPRFYEYDVLRGLSFCIEWAAQRGKQLPGTSIEAACRVVENKTVVIDGSAGLPVERQFHKNCDTRVKDELGNWSKRPSSEFPLLRWTSQVGEISPTLTHIWKRSLATLQLHHRYD